LIYAIMERVRKGILLPNEYLEVYI
jgi:hypothetical protein